MNTKMTWNEFQISLNLDARVEMSEQKPGRTVLHIEWDEMNVEAPMAEIFWQTPVVDIQHTWHPDCGKNRGMAADWMWPSSSRLATSAPAFVFFNGAGRSRLAVAFSDVLTEISVLAAVHEENGMLIFRVKIPLDATGLTHIYDLTIYRDESDVTFAQAIRKISRWWEEDCGLTPMPVPMEARLPVYSTWYSYHQATIAADIEAECAEAAKMGMKTVIVDDGWQTDDGNRGYGYCGDWKFAPKKIPDMAAHVKKIHDLGMKYMLWYSVPFIGEFSENWDRFSDKLAAHFHGMNCGVLDMRYPECRQFLIDTYVKALKEWDLDGFKLDFIDSVPASSKAPAPKEGMDYIKMEDAVLRLMTDVMNALRAIKPEIMIEFRQKYIGPAMRTFGNMFRVSDCPSDHISNRVGMVDLRLLSGDTAVHSDMLMWHNDDRVEVAARQIQNILFTTPQISVRLDGIPQEHKRMVAFWMNFMIEHQALLQGEMEVEAPEMLYPLIRTRLGGEEAIALYTDNHVVTLSDAEKTYLVNASAGQMLTIRTEDSAARRAKVFNCFGDQVADVMLPAAKIYTLDVPEAGYACIVK